jgi:hypothetical protein
MKLRFNVRPYRTHTVEPLANCFAGQPGPTGVGYGKPMELVKW